MQNGLRKEKCSISHLGDPTVYSTYIYVHKRVEQLGYATEIVSGITSFCAVSARFNEGLVEKSQQLHVIPASYQIEEALKASRNEGSDENRQKNAGSKSKDQSIWKQGRDD